MKDNLKDIKIFMFYIIYIKIDKALNDIKSRGEDYMLPEKPNRKGWLEGKDCMISWWFVHDGCMINGSFDDVYVLISNYVFKNIPSNKSHQ